MKNVNGCQFVFLICQLVITIKPKSDLCELHEVKVLRSVDPVESDEEAVTVNQHRVTEDSESTEEQLPPGIKLEGPIYLLNRLNS